MIRGSKTDSSAQGPWSAGDLDGRAGGAVVPSTALASVVGPLDASEVIGGSVRRRSE